MQVRSLNPEPRGSEATEYVSEKHKARGSEATENESVKHKTRGSEATNYILNASVRGSKAIENASAREASKMQA